MSATKSPNDERPNLEYEYVSETLIVLKNSGKPGQWIHVTDPDETFVDVEP